MAQIQEVRLVDDLDGSTGDESIEFSVDGKSYEIDLSAANAAMLRERLEPFVKSARRPSTSTARRVTSTAKMTDHRTSAERSADRERGKLARAWAIQQGVKVAERGRISSEVMEAYDAMGTSEGVKMLKRLLIGEGGDGDSGNVTNGVPINEPAAFVAEFKAATEKQAAKGKKSAKARTAEDVTDEEVLKYREDNGLEVKRRGKDGTGKVYPMAMASYRKHFMAEHGIAE